MVVSEMAITEMAVSEAKLVFICDMSKSSFYYYSMFLGVSLMHVVL